MKHSTGRKFWQLTTTKNRIAFNKKHLGCLDSHGQRKKPMFIQNLQYVCSFLSIRKEGTRNWVNCKTLKRDLYFWLSIGLLVLANSCASCRRLRNSLSFGNKQTRNKNTLIFSVRDHVKFVILTELPLTKHFQNRLAASAKCFQEGRNSKWTFNLEHF